MRHILDEDLVRLADGELSSQRSADVAAHLEACWDCRARMEEIESTITGFVRSHHAEFDGQLPSATGPRALLRARLAELASATPADWWRRFFQFGLPGVAIVCLPLIAIAIGVVAFRY